ncbi:PKD domain-containing protein [Flavobacterium jejuense]|uniref:PKD domain-containing protein n=1 Tax=Flavobacterium jejuense TaxID=1544455 RepID=A0ABX0IX77_9FLAO|nr:PKD domain-containing protein [Flavobacterium jejuense]NHN28053.1 PKD domain-containing protein [Flavobacterium jejuense]
MNANNQIKTHFDNKVVITFILVFILSCSLLAFKKSKEVDCSVFDFETDSAFYMVDDLITFSEGSEKAYSWRWYFGDGTDISYKSKVVHFFSKPGNYKVKLLVNGTCEVEKTLKVIPKPVEEIKEQLIVDFDSPVRVIQGDVVQFLDKTEGAETWEWKFGESSKVDSKSKNPKYKFTSLGVKTISLVINGDKKNRALRDIVVVARPVKTNTRKPVKNKIISVDTVPKVFSEEKIAPTVIKAVNENELEELLYSISDNKISLINFKNQFCLDNAPKVRVNSDSRYMTLEQFYKSIKNKGIKVREVKIYKEKDKCIETIYVNFKYKTFF